MGLNLPFFSLLLLRSFFYFCKARKYHISHCSHPVNRFSAFLGGCWNHFSRWFFYLFLFYYKHPYVYSLAASTSLKKEKKSYEKVMFLYLISEHIASPSGTKEFPLLPCSSLSFLRPLSRQHRSCTNSLRTLFVSPLIAQKISRATREQEAASRVHGLFGTFQFFEKTGLTAWYGLAKIYLSEVSGIGKRGEPLPALHCS